MKNEKWEDVLGVFALPFIIPVIIAAAPLLIWIRGLTVDRKAPDQGRRSVYSTLGDD